MPHHRMVIDQRDANHLALVGTARYGALVKRLMRRRRVSRFRDRHPLFLGHHSGRVFGVTHVTPLPYPVLESITDVPPMPVIHSPILQGPNRNGIVP